MPYEPSIAQAIGLLKQAALIAIAIWNAKVAMDMAKKEMDIAETYLDIAEKYRKHYKAVFQPLEEKELADLRNEQPGVPEFDIAVGRHMTMARVMFRGRVDASLRCTSAYCTGLRAALVKDALEAEAAALASMAALGRRNEQAYADAMTQRLWDHRFAVLNRGRDMQANAASFGALAAGIFGDLAKQAGQGAAGALYWLGYENNRRETQYPPMFDVYNLRKPEPSLVRFDNPPAPAEKHPAEWEA